MNRSEYVNDKDVQGFIAFLADIICGEPLNFTVGFSRNQLYDGFERKFAGEDDCRERGGPLHVVFAETLQDLFEMYWWNRADFDANMRVLNSVGDKIKMAIAGEDSADAQALAEAACDEVMRWGFGAERRAYTANMNWAKRQQNSLARVLRVGRESLSGDNPDLDVFGDDEARRPYSPRMNAGWTKYYALALSNHIIYDGRVGAALGFLVARYLATHGYPEGTPEKLGFLWANGDGGGKSRDPSTAAYSFGKLYRGRHGSKSWARANVRANWILAEALAAARNDPRAAWCAGADGLRRLEAALFMLGYDFSRARTEFTPGPTLPDEANRTGLRTASGNGYFEYSGTPEAGIEFFYGRNLSVTGRVGAETIDKLQAAFAPLGSVPVGTSFDSPPEGSIGHWLLSLYNQNLACYLIPTLEHFGLGTYDKSRRRFQFAAPGAKSAVDGVRAAEAA
ncbi:hypothetical protein [Burkholderia multivorans]|uniref:hypothetical protein n=1 Tax=Burkholderia multivorans TaxID=87883 RepID=UPI0011B1EC42|nr:hypothetical protein [Burkholderia multivorans]MBR8241535.1 hypothetical protein [Burkholderia multivorans]MDN7944812.1 hypothetical protein [Burkholderia multivorans]MDR9175235.1 hypothetical protein [Burkholderia multivorans]MDR9178897.1 hypothetical protein [Burkholderia multivorans]MDR9192757.1 hypothetical protein [Burkholderia multivorans]